MVCWALSYNQENKQIRNNVWEFWKILNRGVLMELWGYSVMKLNVTSMDTTLFIQVDEQLEALT